MFNETLKPHLAGILMTAAEILLALGFLMFVSVMFTAKPNLGSFVGAGICAVLLAALIKHKTITAIIASAWMSTHGRIILILLAAAASVCISAAAVLSVLMTAAADKPPETPQTVIVLGCRVKPDRPSLMLLNRIEAAYGYLSENPDSICIASGGQGNDEPMSEAECIKNELIARGISPERIICEDSSTSTYENLKNSALLLDEMELDRTAVIVTSEYHQLRASIIAKKQGYTVYSVSARTPPLLLPSYWIREWFGVIYEYFIV